MISYLSVSLFTKEHNVTRNITRFICYTICGSEPLYTGADSPGRVAKKRMHPASRSTSRKHGRMLRRIKYKNNTLYTRCVEMLPLQGLEPATFRPEFMASLPQVPDHTSSESVVLCLYFRYLSA